MPNYSQADPYEREPLDSSSHDAYESPRGQGRSHRYEYEESHSPYYDGSPTRHYTPPYGRDHGHQYGVPEAPHSNPGYEYDQPHLHSQGPAPPPHASNTYYHGDGGRPAGAVAHDPAYGHQPAPSTITPGVDNFSDHASGGMAGIAYNVADQNARESGMQAIHDTRQVPPPPSRAQNSHAPRQPYPPQATGGYGYEYGHESNSSLAAPGAATLRGDSRSRSPHSYNSGDPYVDDPYQSYSTTARGGDPNLGVVNPLEIEDDDDDGIHPRQSQQNSMLTNSDRGARLGVGGGVAGAVGKGGPRTGEGYYDPPGGMEKTSAWAAHTRPEPKSKKKKWFVIALVALIIIGAIVGGVVGGLIAGNKGGGKEGSSKQGQSAQDDFREHGDLDKSSDDIKALLNNPDLHKVFLGMDYTPLNTQYPDCVHNPPSQNNVTRDVAVLSQLTNKIRLYGTDCNQTQMVIHAIRQLDLASEVKVWMGVWQDKNTTTNKRQLDQMWDILDEYGAQPFAGIIVANEILFRKEMDITELASLLDEVRDKLDEKKIDLHVATSDLGTDWDQSLANSSDYIMANIHPFFGGMRASEAASWTMDFWIGNNKPIWKSDKSFNVISETGWPSEGGTHCGLRETCTDADGSVASIDGMNRFMQDWVCQAMKNGTQYFWFEAFDEPWKISFNEKGKEWEDKWGLMDVNRNLKEGIRIPDCGGTTVDDA
jgi:exo-beta-1,3-glucanase (GH17 family)